MRVRFINPVSVFMVSEWFDDLSSDLSERGTLAAGGADGPATAWPSTESCTNWDVGASPSSLSVDVALG